MHSTDDFRCIQCDVNLMTLDVPNQNIGTQLSSSKALLIVLQYRVRRVGGGRILGFDFDHSTNLPSSACADESWAELALQLGKIMEPPDQSQPNPVQGEPSPGEPGLG